MQVEDGDLVEEEEAPMEEDGTPSKPQRKQKVHQIPSRVCLVGKWLLRLTFAAKPTRQYP